jgi:hypothetical protein
MRPIRKNAPLPPSLGHAHASSVPLRWRCWGRPREVPSGGDDLGSHVSPEEVTRGWVWGYTLLTILCNWFVERGYFYGHPLILPAKNRMDANNFILGKFKSKLSTYKASFLSHGARLELIKSIFSSITVYYMSKIIFSKKFLQKINSIIRNFWWTG